MAIFKGKIRQRNSGGTYDYLLPETTIDMVNGLQSELDIKADSSYVNQQIQASNLAYKESYGTLSELVSTYPNGNNFNHVVLEDGMIYTWVNNTWTNTQIQANGTGIAKNSVDPDKTTFLINDTNKFTGTIVNKDLFGSEGVMEFHTTVGFYTAVVDIKPNTTYSIIKDTSTRFKVATDTVVNREDDVVLQGGVQKIITVASGINYFTFTSGQNDVMLYINYTNNSQDIRIQVVEGTHSTFVDEKYSPTDELDIYSKSEIDNKISRIDITPDKTTFLKRANLYDGNFIRKTLNGDPQPGYTLDNSASGRVAKIEVKPNTRYSVTRMPSSRFKIATDTVLERNGGILNGGVSILIAGASSTYNTTFITGNSDVVLYVDYTNTNQNIYLEVIEGLSYDFTTSNYDEYVPDSNLLVYSKSEIDNMIDKSDVIKILMIGNSFSVDSTQYLSKIAKSAKVEVLVGCAYDSGQSLQGHWNKIQNNQGITSYYKWSIDGTFTSQNNAKVSDIIRDEAWDIITFQQVSSLSRDYNTYQPYLNNLINYAKTNVNNPNVKIGMLMTWAYSSNYQSTNQIQMYNDIVSAYSNAIKDQDLDILIPTATAFQNARTHSDLMAIGNQLTRDGYHANYGTGRYICALTVFDTLLSKINKRDILSDVTFFPKHSDDNNIVDGVDSSKYLTYLSKIAVTNARINPLKITEII